MNIALETARVRAPAFPADATWLNTDRALDLDSLRGHVVILDFWSYCCVNCQHVLPDLKALEERYHDAPVVVIGVHAAKFTSEKDAANVAKAVSRHGIEHPVLVDSEHESWRAYGVRAWPTLVGIDPEGNVAFTDAGETDRDELLRIVNCLLEEGRQAGKLAESPIERRPVPRTEEGTRLAFPGKVLVDGDRLFVADTNHHRIHVAKIVAPTEAGGPPRLERLDVAGSGGLGAMSGSFETASFQRPQGLTLHEGRLIVADTGNHLLRALDLEARTVETIAGTGSRGTGFLAPASPQDVPLRSPWDVQSLGAALVIAMAGSHQLWVYTDEGQTFGALVGSGTESHVDGSFEDAALAQPSGIHWAGRVLLVADSETSSLRAVDLVDRQVLTLVGQGLFDFGDVDGTTEEARFQHPLDVAAIGNQVYVADSYNNKIRRIDLDTHTVSTIVGDGSTEILHEPGGLDVWGDQLVVADTNNHRIVFVDPATGTLTVPEWD